MQTGVSAVRSKRITSVSCSSSHTHVLFCSLAFKALSCSYHASLLPSHSLKPPLSLTHIQYTHTFILLFSIILFSHITSHSSLQSSSNHYTLLHVLSLAIHSHTHFYTHLHSASHTTPYIPITLFLSPYSLSTSPLTYLSQIINALATVEGMHGS